MGKLFNVVGVSTVEGSVTARFAHDMGRVKVLERYKHTAIRFVELPQPMNKEDAAKFALAHADFQDRESQAALGAKAEAKPVAAPKAPKPVVEATAPVAADTLDGLSNENLQPAVDAVKAAKAAVDADPFKRGRRKLIKDTLAKVRERETEEQAAEREAAKEAAQLEVDNYMKDVNEDSLPKFLRESVH